MTTPDDIRSKLSSRFQDKIKQASEVHDERLPLVSVGLTKALDGGLRYGNISVIGGNTGSGKTAMILQSIGLAQKQGKTAAMIDIEGSYDPKWGTSLGVNSEDLLWTKVGDIANASDLCVELIQAGTDIILVDSISQFATSNVADKEGEVIGFNDNNQMARLSVELGKMINMVNFVNDKTAIIFISQIRNNITSMGARGFVISGGKAMEHAANTIVTLTSSQSEKEFIMDDVFNGKVMIEKPVGRNVSWSVKKHRGAGIATHGKYDFYFDGETIGVDTLGEVIDIATLYGDIKKGGSWFTIPNGERFQGRAKVIEYYRNHLDDFEILRESLLT